MDERDMAKTKGLDRIKVAALLLFVTVTVILCAWAVYDAFGESASGSPLSGEYQAAVDDPAMPTPTEWQPLAEPTPYPTDQFDMEN